MQALARREIPTPMTTAKFNKRKNNHGQPDNPPRAARNPGAAALGPGAPTCIKTSVQSPVRLGCSLKDTAESTSRAHYQKTQIESISALPAQSAETAPRLLHTSGRVPSLAHIIGARPRLATRRLDIPAHPPSPARHRPPTGLKVPGPGKHCPSL
jgi:hypothetical protein